MWSVAAWFVPVANIWLVPRTVIDVVRTSIVAADVAERVVNAVRVWWLSLLVFAYVQADLFFIGVADTNSIFVVDIFGAASAGALLYACWRLTVAQERRFALAASRPPEVAAA